MPAVDVVHSGGREGGKPWYAPPQTLVCSSSAPSPLAPLAAACMHAGGGCRVTSQAPCSAPLALQCSTCRTPPAPGPPPVAPAGPRFVRGGGPPVPAYPPGHGHGPPLQCLMSPSPVSGVVWCCPPAGGDTPSACMCMCVPAARACFNPSSIAMCRVLHIALSLDTSLPSRPHGRRGPSVPLPDRSRTYCRARADRTAPGCCAAASPRRSAGGGHWDTSYGGGGGGRASQGPDAQSTADSLDCGSSLAG